MGLYLQAAAGALIAVVLGLTLHRQGQETGLLLTMAVCCMICVIGLKYLEPVLEFLGQLEDLGTLDSDLVTVLLKVTGIGFLSEIAGLICADAGNSALGKSLQILGSAVILWLSIPLFRALLDLLQQILGEL